MVDYQNKNLDNLEETIPQLLEQFDQNDNWWQQHLSSIRESSSLESMVWASWLLALALAKQIIERELTRRAQLPTPWTKCTKCGTRLDSKGMRPRQIQTLVGIVHWQRRVGRCPKGCKGSQRVPLDIALGVKEHQQTSLELIRLACLLAVFVPFETVTVIAQRFTGIQLSAQTIWSWVQLLGKKAMNQLQEEMAPLALGKVPSPEPLSETGAQMPLVIGADGVMIPMGLHEGQPNGSTQWREVKVGILGS